MKNNKETLLIVFSIVLAVSIINIMLAYTHNQSVVRGPACDTSECKVETLK